MNWRRCRAHGARALCTPDIEPPPNRPHDTPICCGAAEEPATYGVAAGALGTINVSRMPRVPPSENSDCVYLHYAMTRLRDDGDDDDDDGNDCGDVVQCNAQTFSMVHPEVMRESVALPRTSTYTYTVLWCTCTPKTAGTSSNLGWREMEMKPALARTTSGESVSNATPHNAVCDACTHTRVPVKFCLPRRRPPQTPFCYYAGSVLLGIEARMSYIFYMERRTG